MKISGTYQSDGVFGKSVRIVRTEGAWKSEYGEAPRIPAFTQNYAFDFGAGLVGIAHFDGGVLRGSFHPKMLGQVNGRPVAVSSSRTDFWIGEFEAVLRDDGNFDVTIKRWDGKWRGDGPAPRIWTTSAHATTPNVIEPEYEIVKDVWQKSL